MSSTVASITAGSPMNLLMSDLKTDMEDMQRRASELQSLQILQCYASIVLNDLPTLTYSRPERDWDRFFERLEEKFTLANVPNEYKEKLARRLLRGLVLQAWVKNAAVLGATYESIRDQTILHFFPKPNEYLRLLRVMTPPAQQPTDTVKDSPTEPAANEESGVDDSIVLPRGGRRPGSSVSSIRSQLAVHRSRLERCLSRHPGQEMPKDSEFVQMAIGLMRPAMTETATQSLNKENLEVFLAEMAEAEAQRQESLGGTDAVRNRRLRSRRVRASTRVGNNNSQQPPNAINGTGVAVATRSSGN